MSEVKLGTLAARKGTDPSVKQFGQRMVTDHSKALFYSSSRCDIQVAVAEFRRFLSIH
jgi:hypothetical protein